MEKNTNKNTKLYFKILHLNAATHTGKAAGCFEKAPSESNITWHFQKGKNVTIWLSEKFSQRCKESAKKVQLYLFTETNSARRGVSLPPTERVALLKRRFSSFLTFDTKKRHDFKIKLGDNVSLEKRADFHPRGLTEESKRPLSIHQRCVSLSTNRLGVWHLDIRDSAFFPTGLKADHSVRRAKTTRISLHQMK